jgi:carbonic anhydrase
MSTVEIVYRYRTGRESGRSRPRDADSARRRLDEGNRAFAALVGRSTDGEGTATRIIDVDRRDLGFDESGKSRSAQRPFAAVLGCSDARVPIELMFNEGPNDLFVVRVAGNGLGGEVVGSLKYAVEHLGATLKCVVVLGHSGCGAVSAAVEVFLDPSHYLPISASHSVRNILDRLLIVVQASAKRLEEAFGPDVRHCPAYREALIETSVFSNAALAAYALQQEIGVDPRASIRTYFGVYLLETAEIWAPRSGSKRSMGLASPPNSLAQFTKYADAVMKSDRIAAILNASPERGSGTESRRRRPRVARRV